MVDGTASFVNISAWRGIPFGSPPIDQLRWSSPLAAQSWKGTFQVPAQNFATPCVQPPGDPMNTGSEGTEDCLFLNVYRYRSDLDSPDKLLPVLFYIHVGGLMAASGWEGEERICQLL